MFEGRQWLQRHQCLVPLSSDIRLAYCTIHLSWGFVIEILLDLFWRNRKIPFCMTWAHSFNLGKNWARDWTPSLSLCLFTKMVTWEMGLQSAKYVFHQSCSSCVYEKGWNQTWLLISESNATVNTPMLPVFAEQMLISWIRCSVSGF